MFVGIYLTFGYSEYILFFEDIVTCIYVLYISTRNFPANEN